MGVQSDIGPNGMPRWRVYQVARELQALAQLAVECSSAGVGQDLQRACSTLDRMRALLGTGQADD